ncbi:MULTISPECIES: aldo/keto reductase [unclassified Sphingobacterium]|uniref:aldo/keto reductase n=1 Tax=Sphingobacterium TaxID=28453 RepID=UPI0010529939|nr:aldo/keto reductase [Sphingobacterium sp. JUb78]MCW2261036.1 L-glyceraldehyde 3-phosphate reductase [Sphingobacterium kitahiroshimense]TCR08329.1 L-glyceraldehyde 3-phosphate reductase [Sphingobacterium sp. JUb78]
MHYTPANNRYQEMEYRRSGNSGIKLSAISLGLWQNFGHVNDFENSRKLIQTAFDSGITHFDLANNYGPPPGSAEENFGKILQTDFKGLRDEMIISSKAGYTMWDGPYGDWGSKKYLVSSLDKSLKRMHLDYVDIFYHHRPDPETPLEETMATLNLLVQQGKALYVGISNYKTPEAKRAIDLLKQMGTPCLIHQPKFSMFERWVEESLLDLLTEEQVGCIPFSPLAQGLLTDKYLHGIPQDSRAASGSISLHESDITSDKIEKIKALNEIALQRNQKLAQMAVSWLLQKPQVTSVLIGASKVSQIQDAVNAVKNQQFSREELQQIENILAK